MDAGQFNRRIHIQARKSTKDDYGQQIDSWVTEFVVWANIRPVSRKEEFERVDAMELRSRLTHTVCVRYNVAMMPPMKADAWRILYPTAAGDRYLNIQQARDLNEAHQYIVFECIEGSETGD